MERPSTSSAARSVSSPLTVTADEPAGTESTTSDSEADEGQRVEVAPEEISSEQEDDSRNVTAESLSSPVSKMHHDNDSDPVRVL